MKRKEYICPHCGAVLNEQRKFSAKQKMWECTNCGGISYGEVYEGENFPGILWFCDDCNALLNAQKGFHDHEGKWRCDQCGFMNALDKGHIREGREIDSDKERIREVVGSCLDDVVFQYNGKMSGVTSDVFDCKQTWQAWHGEDFREYNQLDDVMNDPFYSGKSLMELIEDIDMEFR